MANGFGPENINIGGGSGMADFNPMEYPEVKCKHCGCEIFQPGVMFRKVPGTLFGQAGESVEIPLKIFFCSNCKKLSPQDQDMVDDLVLKANKKETISSIIL